MFLIYIHGKTFFFFSSLLKTILKFSLWCSMDRSFIASNSCFLVFHIADEKSAVRLIFICRKPFLMLKSLEDLFIYHQHSKISTRCLGIYLLSTCMSFQLWAAGSWRGVLLSVLRVSFLRSIPVGTSDKKLGKRKCLGWIWESSAFGF